MSRTSQSQPAFIVGREREQALLFGYLGDALAGRGSLVLLGGTAGIGKTALVRALGVDAGARGCRLLTGACYDAGTTSPYGPWVELAGGGAAPHGPSSFWDPTLLERASNAHEVMAALHAYLAQQAEQQPLLLVLEDVHWADPESLEFLRVFARTVESLPMLLVATYRDDDLRLSSGLDLLIPLLVREANAQRLNLAPLDTDAVQLLLERRYELAQTDLLRLATHLGGRSQGVPLYLVELLRALEEEQRLRRTPDGWALGDLEQSQVPTLVRQVIDGRLARLGSDVRRLLEVAAVIGQDVPLLLWQRVSGASDDLFDEAVERALDAHVLEEAFSGMRLRFTHALVRDALYAGMSLPQRQRRHQQVAEALAAEAGVEPDVVAHHFRQALDPRAAEWFVRAGSRIEQVALLTAAGYFELALDMLGGGDADPGTRGWLLMRRAKLLTYAEPRTALALLESAAALAEDAADALLVAYVHYFRGLTRCQVGEMRAGMTDLEVSGAELARLNPADIERSAELVRQGVVLSRNEVDGHQTAMLAMVGRIDTALERSQAIIARADDMPALAWLGRSIALSLAGRVTEAHEAYAMAKLALPGVFDPDVSILLLYQLSIAQIPYGADDLVERSRIAREGEAAWRRVAGDLGDISPRIAWLPILQIEGDWAAAREVALLGRQSADVTSEKHEASTIILAQLAAAQGDATLSWELVHDLLPSGPQTVPGYIDFAPCLTLMRVAVALCLDRGDLAAARAWLDAHDRWLAWSGAELGRADGQIAWANYFLAAGDHGRSHDHAERALALASDPRQPLAQMAAHRALGVVEAHAGRIVEARQHLEAALALADACAAPYERALTLLTWADHHLRAGAVDLAGAALDEARAICTPLGAVPALARVDALATRLGEQSTVMVRTAPVGLSPREIEVLQLIANGRSNREIAEILFLSARTVERHITNLYGKIGAQGRAEAIAFAHEHSLI